MRGLVLKPVLELIVVEIRGNQLDRAINSAHDHEDPEKHSNSAHSAPIPTPMAPRNFSPRVLSGSTPRAQVLPEVIRYCADANILTLAGRALNDFHPIFGNFPTFTQKGMPTRSASLNLTPGRSSLSSSNTS